MNVLINGTCLSRGPGSWPYHLQTLLSADMINLSLAGVGNNYVFESSMRELCRRSYDLVILTWTTSHHVTLRVDDINRFSDSKNTSLYQSSMNDWPEKIVSPVNDQDRVEKDWIMNVGNMAGSRDTVSRYFDHYLAYEKFPQSLERDLTHIIAMQSFLKVNSVPYVFLYTRSIKRYRRFDYLYQQIDWSRWYLDRDLKTISTQEDSRYSSDDARWANEEGHRLYASLLHGFICDRILPNLGTQSSGVDQDNLR